MHSNQMIYRCVHGGGHGESLAPKVNFRKTFHPKMFFFHWPRQIWDRSEIWSTWRFVEYLWETTPLNWQKSHFSSVPYRKNTWMWFTWKCFTCDHVLLNMWNCMWLFCKGWAGKREQCFSPQNSDWGLTGIKLSKRHHLNIKQIISKCQAKKHTIKL